MTAIFPLNHSPTKAAEERVPNLTFLRIWGCDAYVKHKVKDKLAPRFEKCVFVGYPKETRGYNFYSRYDNKVFIAHRAVFLKREFIAKRKSERTFVLGYVLTIVQLD